MKKRILKWMSLAVLLLVLTLYPRTNLFAASVKITDMGDYRDNITVSVTKALNLNYSPRSGKNG